MATFIQPWALMLSVSGICPSRCIDADCIEGMARRQPTVVCANLIKHAVLQAPRSLAIGGSHQATSKSPDLTALSILPPVHIDEIDFYMG